MSFRIKKQSSKAETATDGDQQQHHQQQQQQECCSKSVATATTGTRSVLSAVNKEVRFDIAANQTILFQRWRRKDQVWYQEDDYDKLLDKLERDEGLKRDGLPEAYDDDSDDNLEDIMLELQQQQKEKGKSSGKKMGFLKRRQLRKHTKQKEKNNKNQHTYRGLEGGIGFKKRERTGPLLQVGWAVLQEQQSQKARGILDHEALASVYSRYSKEAAEQARQQGELDYKILHDKILKEQTIAKTSSIPSNHRRRSDSDTSLVEDAFLMELGWIELPEADPSPLDAVGEVDSVDGHKRKHGSLSVDKFTNLFKKIRV